MDNKQGGQVNAGATGQAGQPVAPAVVQPVAAPVQGQGAMDFGGALKQYDAEKAKKGKKKVGIVITALVVLLLAAIGYIVFDKIQDDDRLARECPECEECQVCKECEKCEKCDTVGGELPDGPQMSGKYIYLADYGVKIEKPTNVSLRYIAGDMYNYEDKKAEIGMVAFFCEGPEGTACALTEAEKEVKTEKGGYYGEGRYVLLSRMKKSVYEEWEQEEEKQHNPGEKILEVGGYVILLSVMQDPEDETWNSRADYIVETIKEKISAI